MTDMTPQAHPPAVTGSCYCRATRWSSSGPPTALTHCHCNVCRKLHGGPFVTYADIASADLTWLDQTELQILNTSPLATRGYCRKCGSMLFMRYDWEADRTGMCAGTIDEGECVDTLPKPSGHIFVEFKAGWYDIPDDSLPMYEGFSPQMKRKLDDWKKRHESA